VAKRSRRASAALAGRPERAADMILKVKRVAPEFDLSSLRIHCKAAILDECKRALRTLVADPDLTLPAAWSDSQDVYEAFAPRLGFGVWG